MGERAEPRTGSDLEVSCVNDGVQDWKLPSRNCRYMCDYKCIMREITE